MNILENVLSADKGGVVRQLANQFGITAEQATSTISALLQTIAGGLKEKLNSGGGPALSNLASSGSLSKFADNPASLASPAALTQGNSILHQLFGDGDLTNIATTIAQKVGISSQCRHRHAPYRNCAPRWSSGQGHGRWPRRPSGDPRRHCWWRRR